MTNVRVTQFYKTKTCPWYSKGRCERTNACRFAHNDIEKRKLPNLCKTSVCNFMVQNGYCDIPNCRYAHQFDELRATDGIYKTSLCFMFMKSRCDAGIYCRHAHGPQELRTPIYPHVVKKINASCVSENKIFQGVNTEKKTKKTPHCIPFNPATLSSDTFLSRKASIEKVGQKYITQKASLMPVKCKSHPIDGFVFSQRSPSVPNQTNFFSTHNSDPINSFYGNGCKTSDSPLNDKKKEIGLSSNWSCFSTPKRHPISLGKNIETTQYDSIPHDEAFTKEIQTQMACSTIFEPSSFFPETNPLYEKVLNGLSPKNSQTHMMNDLSNQDITSFLGDSIAMSVDNLKDGFLDNLRKSSYNDSQTLYLQQIWSESKDSETIQESHLQALEKQSVHEKGEDEKDNMLTSDPFIDKNNKTTLFSFSFENNTEENGISSYYLNKTPNPSYWTNESMTFETLFNDSNQRKESFNETQNIDDWQYDSTCKSARVSFENDFSTQCPSNNSCTSVIYETQELCTILPHTGTLNNYILPVQDPGDCYLTKEEELFNFLTKNDSSTFCDSRQSSFSKKSSVSQTDQTPARKYGYNASKYNYFDKQLCS